MDTTFGTSNGAPGRGRLCLIYTFTLLLLAFSFGHSATAATLGLGPFAQGVYSGTEPFNTSGKCHESGDDCSALDERVRTGDLIQYSWSVTSNDFKVGEADLAAVVFEQTLQSDEEATVRFDGIPTVCLAYPAGPGGDNPRSSLSTHTDGSQTLLCNLGSMGAGELKSFSIPVRPSANSADGSTFQSTQRVYALDAAGRKVVADTTYVDNTVYEISAAPAFDIIANRKDLYQGKHVVADLGKGAGPESGYMVYMSAHIAADSLRKGKGTEALGDEVGFKIKINATAKDGKTELAVPYKMMECIPNSTPWPGTVYGNEQLASRESIGRKVVDSGTCVFTGEDDLGHQFWLRGIDSQGSRYPVETATGQSLSTGPYFVAAYQIGFFVPFSAIEASDGDNRGNGGAINLRTCIEDFDPQSTAGVSNYASGVEPGYNGTSMPDGSESNNCTGPLTLQLSTEGGYNHRLVSGADDSGEHSIAPLFETEHLGAASLEAGMRYAHMETFFNTGSNPLDNFQACFKFDSSVSKLVEADSIGASANRYAFVADNGTAGFNPSIWQVQYGHAEYRGDSPLDNDADGIADFNAETGRYEGNWDAMRSAVCTDELAPRWVNDPTEIGIDAVNVVRFVKRANAASILPGQTFRAFLPLEMRKVFSGGSHDGEPIPVGTVAAALSSFRTDQFYPQWRPTEYIPAPESSQGDGDRVTFTKIKLDAVVSTQTPLAAAGITKSIFAGNSVVWNVSASVGSQLPQGGVARALRVVTELPAGSTYDATCTNQLSEAAVPTYIQYDTPTEGQQTLTWELGDHHSQNTVAPIRFCATTDSFAEENVLQTVKAFAVANNATPSKPTIQSVTLGQTGDIRAAALIDTQVGARNSSHVHTMKWVNFSKTTSIDNPVVISVLPHNGDGRSMSSRDPASDFSGTLRLVGQPVARFSGETALAENEPAIGQFHYTADAIASISDNPDLNTSNWCSYTNNAFQPTGTVTASCPRAWADVTAIKFMSNHKLERARSPRRGQQFSYTLRASGNRAGDVYSNAFGLTSSDFPDGQAVRAKPATMVITTHSIGDFIFVDVNADGKYTSRIDVVAPDGITVELHEAETDALLATTKTEGGTFLFDNLGDGKYYVQIPASEFSRTGPLRDWTAAVNGKAVNEDANHDEDHSGFVQTSASVDGIRTDTVELSVKAVTTPGKEPVGQEPVGDNVFGILDINTNDDYSNLTVDIGLASGDADNDGVLDIFEFGTNGLNNFVDTDNDGVPNYLDSDSDNDGISDGIEASLQAVSLNQTIPAPTASDIAAQGVVPSDGTTGTTDEINGNTGFSGNSATANENRVTDLFLHGMLDSDNDGTPNYLDLDSDNDAVPDALEHAALEPAGLTSSNGATQGDSASATGQSSTPDSDGDGIADYIDRDSDNDGVSDSIEANLSATGHRDADQDGIVDRFDVDITNGSDNNADGIDDSEQLIDRDNDGIPDFLDTDSDNDGLSDIAEYGRVDRDSDGQIDNFVDQDNDGVHDGVEVDVVSVDDFDADGVADNLDADTDGDGIPDAIELFLQSSSPGDDDGLPAYLDLDTDNDGVADSYEFVISGKDDDNDGIDNTFDIDNDTTGAKDNNGDGITDYWLSRANYDSDGDGKADAHDTDSDGDGLSDAFENQTGDANNDAKLDVFVDSNGDGLHDNLFSLNFPESGVYARPDSDADGIIDSLDVDSDNDGLPDALERQVIRASGTGNATSGNGNAGNTNTQNTNAPSDSNGSDIDSTANTLVSDVADFDADGIPDYRDKDSDNDGILDKTEAKSVTMDADGDGISNLFDVDVTGGQDQNSDGIDDRLSINSFPDTDADGIPDHLDSDSDGDTIPDLLEAGAQDQNDDGYIDGFSDRNGDGAHDGLDESGLTLIDTDLDGLTDTIDTDSDNDGIPDSVEIKILDSNAADVDNDGLPDYLDSDSDNDGISDGEEARQVIVSNVDSASNSTDENGASIDSVTGAELGDVDGDGPGNDGGVGDNRSVIQYIPRDTDNDGSIDQRDLDSDNDGVSDAVEYGSGTNPTDSDSDGIADFIDFDSDNDGIPDILEGRGDRDNDGLPDRLDTDSDGDGIADLIEAGIPPIDSDSDGIVDYLDADTLDANGQASSDTNHDGIKDNVIVSALTDSDNDRIPDFRDTDSDNDGIPDAVEIGDALSGIDSNNDGVPDFLTTDSDGDGVSDTVEFGPVSSGANVSTGKDSDADGVPDYRDMDSDNDGIADIFEAGTTNVEGAVTSLTSLPDTDNDGVPDMLDTDSDKDGISDAIEGLRDTDGDGVSDYIDTDSNNDGRLDGLDGTADHDGDGIPDRLSFVGNSEDTSVATGIPTATDADGDSIPDAIENAAGLDASTQTDSVDSDKDGIIDSLDLDSDNDGIPDLIEAATAGDGVADTDSDGVPDYLDLDSDNDGIADAIEGRVDFDNDSIADFRDLDSDNDSIADAVEQHVDSDADGVVNRHDLDSDNDGVPDRLEPDDRDQDGLPGFIDTDSDNDGISDTVESGIASTSDVQNSATGQSDSGETDSIGSATAGSTTTGTSTAGTGTTGTGTTGTGTTGTGTTGTGTTGTGTTSVGESTAIGANTGGINTGETNEGPSGNPQSPQTLTIDQLRDSDSDGTPDIIDLDSDNDSEADASEREIDTDGDGVPDYLDRDSNANGIDDLLEYSRDTDGDGVPDILDVDNDNDGLPDGFDGYTDVDGDQLPNFLDPDSDGDGISDAIEAGISQTVPKDSDNDGVEDRFDLDSDNDGVLDAIESADDYDGDGVPNYVDTDSDGDGIADLVESGFTDSNNDQVIDNFIDSNADGVADSIDALVLSSLDSNGDGVPDRLDGGLTGNSPSSPDLGAVFEDADGDGLSDELEGDSDSDGDGLPNSRDLDSDNDGILDEEEAGFTLFTARDSDADGYPDFIDNDSDNDGLTDVAENMSNLDDFNVDGIIDSFIDSNRNGVDDGVDLMPVYPEDIDLDGLPNHLDLDSDGDGEFDLQEVGGQDNDNDGTVDGLLDVDVDTIPDSVDVDQTPGTDVDGDGIIDSADIDFLPTEGDQDQDGIADSFDIDIDGNGLAEIGVVGGSPTANWPDRDGDGVPDVKQRSLGGSDVILGDDGIIRTGVEGQGSGCSVHPAGSNRADPLLLMLLLSALGLLCYRSLMRRRIGIFYR